MDKSWMYIPNKFSREHIDGVDRFLEFAVSHNHDSSGMIPCPCPNCNNMVFHYISEVKSHLLRKGMMSNYTTWIHHGERSYVASTSSSAQNQQYFDDNDQVMGIINDAYPFASMHYNTVDEDVNDERSQEILDYEKLLEQALQKLYPGCTQFSSLTGLVELLHYKVKSRTANCQFDDLLEMMRRILPEGNTLPHDTRKAFKVLKRLGLGYKKIHACQNDCILYYKEYEALDMCPVCDHPRYKPSSSYTKKKVPHKAMFYFPLTPRLQRLYMSSHTAKDMRWHKEERVDDDFLRHPADGEAWKSFDLDYPGFASEPRNIRLGLATDGFNPFGDMNANHSTWPVVVVPYNLPPWMCMRKEFSMLTLLIPGYPGKDLDVYLRPLIDELKEMWVNGVNTFDKYSGSQFTLQAMLMWTIHDFPAYGITSGWSTAGYNACPVCKDDVTSSWAAGKVCFMGHRRWLPSDHHLRFNTSKDDFDGERELRVPPHEWSGEEILDKLNELQFPPFGKNQSSNIQRPEENSNWTKKSIFFYLPYWSKLKLRHNLDVMHIEKNVCDTLVNTILGIEGKSKDTPNARKDCMKRGIKKYLWLQDKGGNWTKPHPIFTVKPTHKKEISKFLSSVKFPDGYASNISRCVRRNDGKLLGLKSHDCHVLLQRLVPVAIRGFLPHHVVEPITELSRYFQQLCAKTLRKSDVEKLQHEIVLILCKFEQIFPPAFFTVMIHLTIHLASEALLGGPVQYRWMYPFERLMGTYKGYVRNRYRPEASIAEAYIAVESLTFCSMYLRNVTTAFNQAPRYDDGGTRTTSISVFSQIARPFGKARKSQDFSTEDMHVAHWFCLNNCAEVAPFMAEHVELMKSMYHVDFYYDQHRQQFTNWFRERISNMSGTYNEELKALARGPLEYNLYTGCYVNGVKFVIADRDDHLSTQNSGVWVPGDDGWEFYGKLTTVVRLLYRNRLEVIMFKCRWFDTNPTRNGSVKREYGLVSVNTDRFWFENDPFIFATMAKQVIYLNDPSTSSSWKVVQTINHRNIWDIPKMSNEEESEVPNEADQVGSSSSQTIVRPDFSITIHLPIYPVDPSLDVIVYPDDGSDTDVDDCTEPLSESDKTDNDDEGYTTTTSPEEEEEEGEHDSDYGT